MLRDVKDVAMNVYFYFLDKPGEDAMHLRIASCIRADRVAVIAEAKDVVRAKTDEMLAALDSLLQQEEPDA